MANCGGQIDLYSLCLTNKIRRRWFRLNQAQILLEVHSATYQVEENQILRVYMVRVFCKTQTLLKDGALKAYNRAFFIIYGGNVFLGRNEKQSSNAIVSHNSIIVSQLISQLALLGCFCIMLGCFCILFASWK